MSEGQCKTIWDILAAVFRMTTGGNKILMGIRRFGVKICAYSILIKSGLGVKENVLVVYKNE